MVQVLVKKFKFVEKSKVMQVVIPDEILVGTDITPDDIRLEIAIQLYQMEKVSLGKAAEIAGISRWEFQKILSVRKIPLNYSVADLKKDYETIVNMKK